MSLLHKPLFALGIVATSTANAAEPKIISDAIASAKWIAKALSSSGYKADLSLESLKEIVTFNTNGGNDYITRVVVLSVPLLIKTYLGMLISAVALVFLAFVLKRPDQASDYWFAFVISLLFQGFYFWRLNVHLMKMKT